MTDGDPYILFAPWAAAFALACALVSFGFVVQSERKRRIRRKFRALLRSFVSMPEEDGRRLARLIATCVQQNDFNPLKKVKVEQFFEEYLVDLEFKVRLRNQLVELVRHSPSAGQLIGVLEAIESWRSASARSEEYVLQHVRESAERPQDADEVAAFLKSRHGYFEQKTDLLIKDVQDAIHSALDPADAA